MPIIAGIVLIIEILFNEFVLWSIILLKNSKILFFLIL